MRRIAKHWGGCFSRRSVTSLLTAGVALFALAALPNFATVAKATVSDSFQVFNASNDIDLKPGVVFTEEEEKFVAQHLDFLGELWNPQAMVDFRKATLEDPFHSGSVVKKNVDNMWIWSIDGDKVILCRLTCSVDFTSNLTSFAGLAFFSDADPPEAKETAILRMFNVQLNGKIAVLGVRVVSDIPEPSTWAMLLLGLAGLGYAGHRRKKTGRAPVAAEG